MRALGDCFCMVFYVVVLPIARWVWQTLVHVARMPLALRDLLKGV